MAARDTVVIVDDDSRFRRLAGAVFTSYGFQVVGEAEDGEAGIAAVRLHRPEVVLLDVCLPGLDGISIARVLAAEPSAPRIVLTSTDPAYDEEARTVALFLPKDRLGDTDLRELLSSPGT